MALGSIFGPWPLFQFFNLYTVGRAPRGLMNPSKGHYLHGKQHKHRIKARRHPCLEWDPALERAKGVHALDRAVTMIGLFHKRAA
jgi:hypothetical protein